MSLVAGALSAGERAMIANHAASCSGCHALIEGLVGAGTSCEDALVPREVMAGDGRATGMLALRRGTRVGRYVIDEPLGAGGMGIVHAAVDAALDRRIAVKLVRPDRHGGVSRDARERLIREARSLARLSHPNVVTVFDVGEHRNQLFIAMELVDGGSLSAWLRRAPRSTDEIVDRMLEAGRGLAAAHAAGIVHRDIKPDNILVGRDGRARVTDFGLAQLGDAPRVPHAAACAALLDAPLSLTRSGVFVGTPAYMAPEQRARGEAGARADQWSFCATLYEALAGVRPPGASSPALARRRMSAAPAGRRVPRWVQKIVMRGMRADPAARWSSMDALLTALARGRRRWWRRAISSAHAAVMAGVALVLALLAAGVSSSRRRPRLARYPNDTRSRRGSEPLRRWLTGPGGSS